MTVASTLNRKTFAGDNATTSFGTSPVLFFDVHDLDVYVVSAVDGVDDTTLLVEGTDYVATGGGTPAATGTVDLAAGSDPFGAPTDQFKLVIVRNVALTQEADFVQNDSSDAEVAEAAIDRLTMQTQQISALASRGLHLAESDVTGASTELPTPTSGGKLLGWNRDGDAIVNYTFADFAPNEVAVTEFMETVLAGADDPEALMVFIADLQNTADTELEDMLPYSSVSDIFQGRVTTFQQALDLVGDLDTVGSVDLETDLVPVFSASAGALRAISLAALGSSAPAPGFLYGGRVSNSAGDATNDLDFAATRAVDSTNTIGMSAAAMTKRLDATFTAGTGGGMRDAGAIADGTWHLFVISGDAAPDDYLASADPDAPTMPTGYSAFRRLASWLREGGALVPIKQKGDHFQRVTPKLDVSENDPGIDATARLLSVPTGIQVDAIVNWAVGNIASGAAPFVYVSSLDQADQAPSGTLSPLNNAGSAVQAATGGSASWGAQITTRTNFDAEVRTRLSDEDGGNITIYGATLGWIDTRGRLEP